jgi:hypothetical protein
MTALLRTSALPFWADLRRRLHARGVDPERALLVESYGEPPGGGEVGVVVDRTGRVLAYRARHDEWSWSDLTEDWEASDFADQVRVGLAMLEGVG